MKKFWNWIRDETDPEQRTLRLDGVIAQDSWFDDDVTPAAFKSELFAGDGPITVWINSPGGDCVAAAQIYNMLMDYRQRPSAASAGVPRTAHGAPQARNTGSNAGGAQTDVTVQIDGIAASAASVIAMAGTKVMMTPVSLMMIHNPLTCAMGDSDEMRRAINLLDEVKESIINAYELKTSLSRTRISHLMDGETWMNAKKAVELGFCDEIMFQQKNAQSDAAEDSFTFSRRAVTNCLLDKLKARIPNTEKPADQVVDPPAEPVPGPEENDEPEKNSEPQKTVKVSDLEMRLALLKF